MKLSVISSQVVGVSCRKLKKPESSKLSHRAEQKYPVLDFVGDHVDIRGPTW